MDPVLNRPLFRKKALHQEQIRQNKIPGYAIGGLIPLAANLGRAGMAGFRAFRGAQSARAAAGEVLGRYVKHISPPQWSLRSLSGTPTGQKME
jgi:hypothetical protein